MAYLFASILSLFLTSRSNHWRKDLMYVYLLYFIYPLKCKVGFYNFFVNVHWDFFSVYRFAVWSFHPFLKSFTNLISNLSILYVFFLFYLNKLFPFQGWLKIISWVFFLKYFHIMSLIYLESISKALWPHPILIIGIHGCSVMLPWSYILFFICIHASVSGLCSVLWVYLSISVLLQNC